MRQGLRGFACGISLLIAAAVASLWIRSYIAYDLIRITRATSADHRCLQELQNGLGTIVYRRETIVVSAWPRREVLNPYLVHRFLDTGIGFECYPVKPPRRFLRPVEGSFAGFLVRRFDGDSARRFGGIPTVEVWVPHWFLLLMSMLLPSAWVRRRLRVRRRLARGLCPVCCYDLRATHDRCPECGWNTPRQEAEPIR